MARDEATHRWDRLVLAIGAEAVEELGSLDAMETVVAAPAERSSEPMLPAASDENYEVQGIAAEGGMGRILLAHDRRLGRRVAIKELRNADRATRHRFETEVLITARLQHPSIVPIYEAGRWPSGEPFYAMRWIEGETLRARLEQCATLTDRLALLRHVTTATEAAAYAHEQGIAHGDLKPENILVGTFGETQVIDWGLARDVDDTMRPNEPLAGTPAYMAPELIERNRIDRRSDVYALGALLYELLSGSCPHGKGDAREVLVACLEGPPLPLHLREPGIPPELLAIVDKAIARDPEERYPSAKQLAEDLRRFETGKLVAAHDYTTGQRLRRLAIKYRTPLVAIVAATVAMTVAITFSFRRILAERDRAETARQTAAEAQKAAVHRADELTLIQAETDLRRDPNRTLVWLSTLSPGFDDWSAARLLASEARSRGLARVLRGHTGAVNDAAFSPDGRVVVTASDDRTLRWWDLEANTTKVMKGHEDEVWGLHFSPDGKRLLSRGKSPVGLLWDLETHEATELRGHARAIYDEAFLHGGKAVTFARRDGAFIWDVATGEGELVARNARNDKIVAVSPDGRELAYVADTKLHLHNVETGDTFDFSESLEDIVKTIAFSGDGSRVAVADEKGRVFVFSKAEAKRYPIASLATRLDLIEWSDAAQTFIAFTIRGEAYRLELFGGPPTKLGDVPGPLAFGSRVSPKGDLLAMGGADGVVRIWDHHGALRHELRGHRMEVMRVRFSNDGKKLVTCSVDRTARVWDLTRQGGQVQLAGLGRLRDAQLSADGTWVLTLDEAGATRSRGLGGGGGVDIKTGAVAVHWSRDGQQWLGRAHDDVLTVYTRNQKAPVAELSVPGVRQVVATKPGSWVLGLEDGRVMDWDGVSLSPRFSLERSVRRLAATADGRYVAAADTEGSLVIHRAGGDAKRRTFPLPVTAIAFDQKGERVAWSVEDYRIVIASVKSSDKPVELVLDAPAAQLLFSHDGATLIEVEQQRSSVRLIDTAKGTVKGQLKHPGGGQVRHVAIDASDERLAMATDTSAMLWDLEALRGRELVGHLGSVTSLRFDPEGRLVSAGADGTVRAWDDDLPRDGVALRAWLETALEPAELSSE